MSAGADDPGQQALEAGDEVVALRLGVGGGPDGEARLAEGPEQQPSYAPGLAVVVALLALRIAAAAARTRRRVPGLA